MGVRHGKRSTEKSPSPGRIAHAMPREQISGRYHKRKITSTCQPHILVLSQLRSDTGTGAMTHRNREAHHAIIGTDRVASCGKTQFSARHPDALSALSTG